MCYKYLLPCYTSHRQPQYLVVDHSPCNLLFFCVLYCVYYVLRKTYYYAFVPPWHYSFRNSLQYFDVSRFSSSPSSPRTHTVPPSFDCDEPVPSRAPPPLQQVCTSSYILCHRRSFIETTHEAYTTNYNYYLCAKKPRWYEYYIRKVIYHVYVTDISR